MKLIAPEEEASRGVMRPPAAHRRPTGARARGVPREVPSVVPRRSPTAEDRRRLATLPPAPGIILSLYVDLDPARFAYPAARETEVQAVVDEARQSVRQGLGEISHDEEKALLDDLVRARAYLLGAAGFAGARGLALFASTPRGLFEAFRLEEPVSSLGHAGRTPLLRPLFEVQVPTDWAMLAIDRRSARILVSRRGQPPMQVMEQVSRVRGHRESSGARQAWVQRAVDHDTQQHVRRATRRMSELHRRAPVGMLVLACGEEIRPVVERNLRNGLKQRLVGSMPYDPEASAGNLVRRALPLLEQHERAHEAGILDNLEMEVRQGTGAVGVDATLQAIASRSVAVLLLESGIEIPGSMCHGCGWLGFGVEPCPVCGRDLESTDDLVEEILRAAVAQSAEVRFLRFVPPHPGEPAHIAAVLRPPGR